MGRRESRSRDQPLGVRVTIGAPGRDPAQLYRDRKGMKTGGHEGGSRDAAALSGWESESCEYHRGVGGNG
jgi:hypothetical protein